jgi:diguanylate cyclase (GGDEF)-like protein/PAS domain S-box-containing protein
MFDAKSADSAAEGAPDAEIARLRKIIDALVKRAERGAEHRGSDYDVFETAVVLESEVKRRTADLETALHENERIGRAMQYRDTILHAITRSAAELVSGGSVNEAIPRILVFVGEAVSADRILVFEAPLTGPKLRLRHAWHRRPDLVQVTPELVAGAAFLESTQFADWQSRLRAGETVATPLMIAEGETRRLFDAVGILSNLQLPIFVDGAFWGHIAIDDCRSERAWAAAEVDTLRILTDLIGAAIVRDRYTEKLSTADAVVRSSPAVLYRLRGQSAPLPMVYVSENVAKLGCAAKDLLADPLGYIAVAHPEERAALLERQRAVLGGEGEGRFEFRACTGDGRWRWLESRFTPTRRSGGETEIEGVLLDVTERREAEDARRVMLERTQRQFEMTGIVSRSEALVNGDVAAVAREITELAAKATGCERVNAWVFNEDETELHCIDLFEAAHGRHSSGLVLREQDYVAEFQAMKSAKYVNADDPLTDPRTSGYVESYLKPLGITSMLDAVIHASGRNFGLLCFEHVGKRHSWTQDEIAFACQLADKLGFALVNRIRREAEEKTKASQAALAESQQIIEGVFNSVPVRLFWKDKNLVFLGCNAAFARDAGLADPKEIVGKDDSQMAWRDQAEAYRADDRAVIEGGQAKLFIEETQTTADGKTITLLTSKLPLRRPNGEIYGVLGTYTDITERKIAEEQLRRERDFSSAMIEAVPGIFFVLDAKGNNLRFNANLANVTGRSREELKGINALTYVAPESRALVVQRLGEIIAGSPPSGKEVGILHSSGEVHQYHIVAHPIQLENGPGVVGMGVDVTEKLRTERLLRESEERFKGLVENTVDWVWEMDPEFRYTYASPRSVDLFGYTPEDLLGRSAFDFMTPEDAKRTMEETADLFAERRPMLNYETTFIHKTGRVVITETNASPFFDAEGNYCGYRGIDRDITERKRMMAALGESEEKFRTVFSTVKEGIFLVDPVTARYVEFNQSCCDMFGYRRDEIIGHEVGMLSSGEAPYSRAEALALVEKARVEGTQTFEWQCKAKDGRLFWAAMSARYTAFGATNLVLATMRDITEQKQAAAQILQMARFDALTGLANRRVFAESVAQAIARNLRGGKAFAVLYLDLDHFKDVNDTLGHPVGDLLLKSVAERLKACVRATDTVARFGGDEFAVLAVDINEPMDAGVLGEKILAALSQPVTINGNDIHCGTSVGIAVFGPDSGEAENLLTHADVALYRAKSEGRGTFRFFTDAMDADVRKRVTLDSDLRMALEQNQFFLAYQPQVEAASGRITGMEALVRWRHPERGIVPPAEFIPAAEKNGLIVPLGRWVLREACRQAKAWREAGIPPAVMGVNLSALQFKTPRELEQCIADALAENELPPNLLELELTESVLMKASHEHNDVLLRLRQRGLRLAIDDFGTGFSSLDYLRRFPVDRIKIAQVFIIDLVTAAGDAAIVKAAIGLARELGINIIAEGVETAAQLRLLQSWGCREVQGYYFAKPLTADEIAPLLRAGKVQASPAATGA